MTEQPSDVRTRRGLLVLAAVLATLAIAGPVQAKTEKINFVPGTDISSWYWERQVDEEVTTPVPLPPPIPPASQRARLPSGQYQPTTLPVAVYNGQPERMAAIRFDLTERGYIDGTKYKELLLFIEESADRNEHPQVSPETAKIQACQILDFLAQGENERFKDAPKYDDKDCVEGTRDATPGAPAAVWTFDLTKIAQDWGASSFDNNGVMLVPVLEASKTWEVHFKVPQKENPTVEGDQYEATKERAFVTLDAIPGEPLEIPDVPTETETAPLPSSSSSGTSTIPSSGITGSPILPSTDLGGTTNIPGAEATAPAVPSEQAAFTPLDTEPRMPSYVWLAIPLGLLALSAVRSVILEPVGGPRPDGVISAIRRRNAERRGGAIAAQRGGAFSRMSGGLRRGARGVGRALGSVTRGIRRKR
jgi:hypothetical protein